jgi:prophage DNA circulation protein
MGKSAIRYQMTGYLIGPSYNVTKKALINALESSSGAQLVDPYLGQPKMCICERYSVTESRERGGYCAFEMAFVEVGTAGNDPVQMNSSEQLKGQASTTGDGAAETLNQPSSDASRSGQGIGHA